MASGGPNGDDLAGDLALVMGTLVVDLGFLVGDLVVGEARELVPPLPRPSFPRYPPLPRPLPRALPRPLPPLARVEDPRGEGVCIPPPSPMLVSFLLGEWRLAAAATRAEIVPLDFGVVLLLLGDEILAAFAKEVARLVRVGVEVVLTMDLLLDSVVVLLGLLLLDLVALVVSLEVNLLELVGGESVRRDTLNSSSSSTSSTSIISSISLLVMTISGRGAVVPWVMWKPVESVGDSLGSGSFLAWKRMVWFASSLESPL